MNLSHLKATLPAGTRGLYISEAYKKYNFNFEKNKLNAIIAPTGAGKTHWFFNDFIKKYERLNSIVYLTDTTMLRDAMTEDERYKDKIKIFEKNDINLFDDILGDKSNKVICMTYAMFGYLLKNNKILERLSKIDTIIADEAHKLIDYKNKFGGVYENIIEYFKYECCHKNIILLTATPYLINKEEEWRNLINDITKNFVKELNNMYAYFDVPFTKVGNVVRNINTYNFKHGLKCLYYSDKIKKCIEMKSFLNKMGIKAECLWSENNKENPLSKEQEDLRSFIIKEHRLPCYIDVLIINGAYQTGWNLNDPRVQLVICDCANYDTRIQVRGRVRIDGIAMFMYRVKADNEVGKTELTIDDKWLNRYLKKTDKTELCDELGLKNQNGIPLKWTSVKKMLIENGYSITDANVILGKRTRVSIITEKFE